MPCRLEFADRSAAKPGRRNPSWCDGGKCDEMPVSRDAWWWSGLKGFGVGFCEADCDGSG